MSTKAEPGDERLLTDANADIVDRIGALDRLGVDRRPEIEATAAQWLTHEMTEAREQAVRALVGNLSLDKYVDDALRLLVEDPSHLVRIEAASALAFFARRKQARHHDITTALAKTVLHDPHPRVVAEAYFGIDFVVIRGTEPPHFTEIPREQYDMALVRKLAGEDKR